MRVHFLTLGCPKNEVDSDRMRARVAASAWELADTVEDADTVVVNTCGFIEPAAEESVEAVLALARDWKAGRADRSLVVAGCLVSRYGADLADSLPEVDAFVPVAEEGDLPETLERLSGEPARAGGGPARTAAGVSAYLKVSDGCHRACAYCTIPAIRGPYVSYPPDALLAEARELAGRGARELVLVGQDVTAYGRDVAGHGTLAALLPRLAGIDGVEWLRVMYAQPDGVTAELLEAMAALPEVCRYLDMPLQHASREVLRRMGRSGDAETFLALVSRIREVMPDVALRTTLIAGFPGETEADVDELLEFLEEARLDYVAVFPYYPEEGTRAAGMPGLPPAGVRAERGRRVFELAEEIGHAKAAELAGSELEVLVESAMGGLAEGRMRGQAPEVDGGVTTSGDVAPGQLVRVRIEEARGYDLLGAAIW